MAAQGHTRDVEVTINNNTNVLMVYGADFFSEGQLAASASWPRIIKPDCSMTCVGNSSSTAGVVGDCAGFVTYTVTESSDPITVAFYCGTQGNKMAVGADRPMTVYGAMESFEYKQVKKTIKVGSSDVHFTFQCTAGMTNKVTVTITASC